MKGFAFKNQLVNSKDCRDEHIFTTATQGWITGSNAKLISEAAARAPQWLTSTTHLPPSDTQQSSCHDLEDPVMVWVSGNQDSHPTMVRGPPRNFSQVIISLPFTSPFLKRSKYARRVFLLPSNAPRAVLSFATNFCHITHLWKSHPWSSCEPSGQPLSLPFPSTRPKQPSCSPAYPGTVSCHTSPAALGITGCANSHLLLRPMMSLQTFSQSPWASVLLLCAGDNRAPPSHRDPGRRF